MELPIVIKINLNSKNRNMNMNMNRNMNRNINRNMNRIKKSYKKKSSLLKYYNLNSKSNLYKQYSKRNYKLIYPTIYEHPDE